MAKECTILRVLNEPYYDNGWWKVSYKVRLEGTGGKLTNREYHERQAGEELPNYFFKAMGINPSDDSGFEGECLTETSAYNYNSKEDALRNKVGDTLFVS